MFSYQFLTLWVLKVHISHSEQLPSALIKYMQKSYETQWSLPKHEVNLRFWGQQMKFRCGGVSTFAESYLGEVRSGIICLSDRTAIAGAIGPSGVLRRRFVRPDLGDRAITVNDRRDQQTAIANK